MEGFQGHYRNRNSWTALHPTIALILNLVLGEICFTFCSDLTSPSMTEMSIANEDLFRVINIPLILPCGWNLGLRH